MRCISCSVKSVSTCSMNGASSSRETKTTRIFGTKVRVASWIWVKAWNSEMMRPTMSEISMIGVPIFSTTITASRLTSRSAASSMAILARVLNALDRHPQDFLVGGDGLVADRGDCLQGHFRRGDRRHHVGDIGLAGGSEQGLLFRFGAGLHGI